MTAPSDTSSAPAKADALAQPLSGAALVAAYRAARAAQRVSLQQSHAARRRSQEDRLGEASAAAEPPPSPGDEPTAGSIFANLVSLAVAERNSAIVADQPPPQTIPSPPEPPTTAATPAAQEAAADVPPAGEAPIEPAYDPPLAEFGFGPGMLIRLSQLGLHTTGDLAQADAGELRAALGDISRLVDVETWISNARHTARTG